MRGITLAEHAVDGEYELSMSIIYMILFILFLIFSPIHIK